MTRIYMVSDKRQPDGEKRLVRAANVAQARNHVARDSLACAVASQEDLVTLVGNGTRIESASSDVLSVGSAATV